MTRSRFVVLTLLLAALAGGCAATDDAGTTTTVALNPGVQRQPEGSSAFFSIEEIVLGDDGYVTLNNFTTVPVTLDGLHLCQGPDCFAMPNEIIEPGGNALIAVGARPSAAGTVVTGATIGSLTPSDGELALYVTDPTDREHIIGYLQWGATPHQRTEEAIAKGLWNPDSFAPSGFNAIRLFRNPDSGLWLWDAAP